MVLDPIIQLLSIVEEIHLALDHRLSVELIFIDFHKAFDTVPHQRLLKSYHYGIQGGVYNWIFNWFRCLVPFINVILSMHILTILHI